MVAPAIIAGLGGAAISAAGSYFSGKQASDFAERSYKHRYQWQVKDLQKAGLNPMLAVSQGAPNVSQPQFPNIGDAAVKGYSAASQTALLKEQVKNVRADTNLKMAQASATIAPTIEGQERLPYAARRAEIEANTAMERLTKLGYEMRQLDESANLQEWTQEKEKRLQPLLIRYQELMNQAAEYGLSEKEADAVFWESVGGYGKMAPWVIQALKMITRD